MATKVSPGTTNQDTVSEGKEYRDPGLVEELKRFHGQRFEFVGGQLIKAPTTEAQDRELDRIRQEHGKADSKLAHCDAVLRLIRDSIEDDPKLSNQYIALCGVLDTIEESRAIYGFEG